MLSVSTTDTDTQQPDSADTSSGKLFTKWCFWLPNIESNLRPNPTELHGFRRLAIYPISFYPHSPGKRRFSFLFSRLGNGGPERGSLVQEHSQEVAQCQALKSQALRGFLPLSISSLFIPLTVIQRLTVGQARLALVFYKLPAKKFLRLWSSKKKLGAWLKSPYCQASCFLLLGCSASRSVLS